MMKSVTITMKMLRATEYTLALGLGLLTAACLGGEEDAPPPSPEPSVPARTAGWTNLDVIPYEPVAQAAGAQPRSAERPLEELSREELAGALRPVLIKPDGLYVMRGPHWAAADAVHRAGALSMSAGDPAPFVARAPGDAAEDLPAELSTIPQIIGGDGRTVVSDTTAAPFSAMARVLITFDSGSVSQCTGTYIGPWTFILAGHCLRQPSGAVARRMLFEPARNGGALPFGSFDCRNDDASTSNDFLAAIPYAFATSADPAYDFAVMDTFPCHSAPRWLGQPSRNQGIIVDAGDSTYSLHGYPGNPCPGAPSGFLFNCGMSGSVYANGPWFESEYLDSEGGQSGGPWHVANRVVATHIGYREYFDFFRCGFDVCRRNYGRRIDGTYKTFLDAIAFDYP